MTVTFPLVAIVGLVVFIAYRYMGLRVWHALVSLIFGFLLAATSVGAGNQPRTRRNRPMVPAAMNSSIQRKG